MQAGTLTPYYLLNALQFKNPSDHAQDPTLPANSSLNAPIHKFRWLHVPGSAHQGLEPFLGPYTYTVTPRYFGTHRNLLPIDPSLGAAVTVDVGPFAKNGLELGFTRGFTQSQAFVRHFGRRCADSPEGQDAAVRHVGGIRRERGGHPLHVPRRIRMAGIHGPAENLRRS